MARTLTSGDKTSSIDRPDPIDDAGLDADELRKMDAYWRAANYLSVGQIYLFDNPCLLYTSPSPRD